MNGSTDYMKALSDQALPVLIDEAEHQIKMCKEFIVQVKAEQKRREAEAQPTLFDI